MRVLFISSGTIDKQPSPIVLAQGESIRKKGVSLEYFTINKKGLKGYLTECLRLRSFLKRNRFDILHAHYGLSAIVSLIAKQGEKLSVSFMGDDILGSNRSNGSITLTSRIFANVNSLLAKVVYDFSIVKSDEMLKKIKSDNVTLLPNGVNVAHFYPEDRSTARERLELDHDKRIILFVSNPSRTEKNYTLAKEAVSKVNIPGVDLLTVYEVPQKTLAGYYNAADILILTSFHEGSPNVVKEAMACNCPIVSTDIGDVRWIMGETKGCFLTSFNVGDVADKITMALEYSALHGRTNGRERIFELGLDESSIAKKVINIYERLLS